MSYKDFIQDVKKLGFFENQAAADAACKAVLGILASSLEEPNARKLTDSLPEPLTYDRLRGHQARTEVLTLDEYLATLGTQFRLNHDQAKRLVDTVFHLTKENLDKKTLEDIEDDLPSDIADELEKA